MAVHRIDPPQTLLAMARVVTRPAAMSEGVLVIIDAQEEYRTGRLPLAGIEAAVAETVRLLTAAREEGMPVIHVVHHAATGSPLFDPATPGAAIMADLTPVAGEAIVVKRLPNAFTGTKLAETLAGIADRTGRRSLVLAGFMTHNCVSATARAALDRGLPATVVAAATATRDLPALSGGTIRADLVQAAELAALADRTAVVVSDAGRLPGIAPVDAH